MRVDASLTRTSSVTVSKRGGHDADFRGGFADQHPLVYRAVAGRYQDAGVALPGRGVGRKQLACRSAGTEGVGARGTAVEARAEHAQFVVTLSQRGLKGGNAFGFGGVAAAGDGATGAGSAGGQRRIRRAAARQCEQRGDQSGGSGGREALRVGHHVGLVFMY